jgi:N-acetylglucosamine kinase-like BadF-type ATPase
VVADPVVAFAGGTTARSGAVLIAGSGTIASWIDGVEVVSRIDGHGWLVGDDGSGFWLGRQAVRAVLAELDGRGQPTVLRYAVLATVAECDQLPDTAAEQMRLLRSAVYHDPPIALARLAPLVPAAAETGDRVAQRIVDRAVILLVDTIEALLADAPAGASGPIVLAGSLLTAGGPIRREVQRRVADRHGQEPLIAFSGAAGAAWLALRDLGVEVDESVHDRLTKPALSVS